MILVGPALALERTVNIQDRGSEPNEPASSSRGSDPPHMYTLSQRFGLPAGTGVRVTLGGPMTRGLRLRRDSHRDLFQQMLQEEVPHATGS